jgi:hypothetical protein
MASLDRGGLLISAAGLVVASLLLLGHLDLSGIEGGAREAVTEHVHSAAQVTLEAGEVEASDLAIDVGADAGTHTLKLFSELALGGAG